ncbi:MAG: hypothetical protein BWX64_02592 [Acidobacteria bacterium ADurb.Bin051]|nr:MAG: hypothetical protein BWX64_02592 [Acidobacteria bacterium ADurb.Bin051]
MTIPIAIATTGKPLERMPTASPSIRAVAVLVLAWLAMLRVGPKACEV